MHIPLNNPTAAPCTDASVTLWVCSPGLAMAACQHVPAACSAAATREAASVFWCCKSPTLAISWGPLCTEVALFGNSSVIQKETVARFEAASLPAGKDFHMTESGGLDAVWATCYFFGSSGGQSSL